MKKQALTILKFAFFLGIGLLLVWLAVRNKTQAELETIKTALLDADYSWIMLSFLIAILSHVSRAIRWKMLLVPMGHHPKTSNVFFAVMVGYLANLALPRLGEITRCGVLKQYERVPFAEGFGSVIAERAFDFICLVLIFFITLLLEFEKISGIANEMFFNAISEKLTMIVAKRELLLSVVFAALLIIGIVYYLRKRLQNFFVSKIKALVIGLWHGLLSIKNVQQPISFLVHTVLIWLMYIVQVYVCFLAFPETSSLSFVTAMTIMIFGSLGIIIVPGGTGAYQAIVIQILTTVYFISETSAFAFAWASWGSQIVLLLVLGLVSLVMLPLLNKKLTDVD